MLKVLIAKQLGNHKKSQEIQIITPKPIYILQKVLIVKIVSSGFILGTKRGVKFNFKI